MPPPNDPVHDRQPAQIQSTKIAGLILAAGASTRMGRPKQLLKYGGMSLLRRAAKAAIDSDLDPLVVVLGAHAELLVAELAGLQLQSVVNEEWRTGMGSSIRTGIRAINAADFDAFVILLIDQPSLTPAVIRRLVAAFRATGAPIVASEYSGAIGVPALFDRAYLPRLAELPDDRGAKGLIVSAGAAVQRVPFQEGFYDIDTPQDYKRLRGKK